MFLDNTYISILFIEYCVIFDEVVSYLPLMKTIFVKVDGSVAGTEWTSCLDQALYLLRIWMFDPNKPKWRKTNEVIVENLNINRILKVARNKCSGGFVCTKKTSVSLSEGNKLTNINWFVVKCLYSREKIFSFNVEIMMDEENLSGQ